MLGRFVGLGCAEALVEPELRAEVGLNYVLQIFESFKGLSSARAQLPVAPYPACTRA